MDFKKRIKTGFAAMLLLGGFWTVSNVYGGPPAGAGADPTKTAPSSSEAATSQDDKFEKELQQLRQLVELQQSRINELEAKVNGAKEAAPAASPVIASTSVTGAGLNLTGGAKKQETLTSKTENSNSNQSAAVGGVPGGAPAMVAPAIPAAPKGAGLEEVAHKQELLSKKVDRLEGKVKGFGPFTFSGDIRVRHESFFNGGPINAAAIANRNRERYRLRFNVLAKLNDELSGGFTLASGDLGDPISTNSTETGFFTRKPIAIDRAFVDYKPKYFKPLSVSAGKFAYTWENTELTFDKDINVEGASEKVAWDWNSKVLSHFALVGFELPLFEVGAGPDSDIVGGQLQTGWKLGSRVKIAADTAFYDYQNPDTIAQNQTNGNGFATQGISTGQGGTFGFSAATLTNSFGVIGGKREFASRFGILDSLFKLNIDTGLKRFPLTALFDFEQNTRACQNVNAFVVASVAISCNPRDRQGYWAEAQFGKNKEKGDFSFDYVFARIEREATVSAFVASDFRQPTNVAQHRLSVSYVAYRNFSLDFTTFIGRQLATAQTPTPERWLERLQMDVNYKF